MRAVIGLTILLIACTTAAPTLDASPADADEADGGADASSPVCPGLGSWRVGPSTNDPREAAGLALLAGGRVLSIGGHNVPGIGAIGSVEVLDGLDGSWQLVAPLRGPRTGIPRVVVLADGRVLVADYYYSAGPERIFSPSELYDPVLDVWTETGPMLVPPAGSVTKLADGRVLTAAGFDWSVERPLARAEIYDPATSTWAATGSMAEARAGHAAVRLADGRVLVAGGYFDALSTGTTSVEIFDPATGTFETAAPMHVARAGAGIVLLDDGRVLIVGGDDVDSMADAELFDPTTGAWTDTAAMATPRSLFTLTVLPSGAVLAVGGNTTGVGSTSTAERWDPATGAWSSAGCMRERRSAHQTLLLPSGEVVVVGGFSGLIALRSVEVYTPEP